MMVRFMLANRFPHLLWWGPDYIQLYNDHYIPILGTKHPQQALGKPFKECWPEVYDILIPLVDTPFNGGPSTWMEDSELIVRRRGFPEESHFMFSYSAIPDDTAPRGIGGVLATVHEITEKVVAERRVKILSEMTQIAEAKTDELACLRAIDILRQHPKDVPFALIYLLDETKRELRLVSTTGVPPESVGPAALPLGTPVTDAAWPLSKALETETLQVRADLASAVPKVPAGPWPDPPSAVAVVPIKSNIAHRPAGALVVGISACLRPDALYMGFLELLGSQVATAIANARAYEVERRRAEALAEIDRAKTTFFSNVSHEFRTPLTLMLGPIEDALSAPETPASVRAQLEVAQRNSQRLLKLVNSLLDFSRIEAGRVQASFSPVDLAALTADLSSIFRSAMERAKLEFEVDCQPLGEPVYVDREMWEKIVLNLLSNAFKFTLKGSVRVRVAREGGQAVLRVSDTGVGVPDHEIPRLFDRFHRVEGAQARTHEGSGIGLALVQELVKLHGGSVDVASQLGVGTSFYVRLPFGTAHIRPERIKAAPSLASTAIGAHTYVQEALRWLSDDKESAVVAPAEGHDPRLDARFASTFGARVLLADDNADMRSYVRELLSSLYDVETVADGAEALEAARRSRPDLILTDVMMPKLDGFALLQAVRADRELRDVPVIMLSARAGEESRIEGLGAGADDYIVKPFYARELLARVGALLELTAVRREIDRNLNATLEREIAQRTEQLHTQEEALRQAQKMEAVGQLTGGVAHDFNNLLQVIVGNLELIRRLIPEDDSRIQRAAEQAMNGARQASSLTQRLLAFSRRQPLDPKPIDINSLVGGMSDLLNRSLGETITVETVRGAGLWKVEADPNALESTLLNLAVNARDAMPKGGRLTIETTNAHIDAAYAIAHAELLPGQYVAISVADTGLGMDAETLRHAFEPFFTTKPVGKGTGLGLSQVYGFVKQSGGHVKIYSEVGQGTTVKIYLPRLERSDDEPDAQQSMPVPEGTPEETILVVEDDENVRTYSVEALRELGYRVIEAQDGLSALRLLENKTSIDLLFTDVVLPGGMTGAQIAARARQLHPNLKILFATGYARNAIFHHGRLDRGVQLLAKPFAFTDLAAKVREVLDGFPRPYPQ